MKNTLELKLNSTLPPHSISFIKPLALFALTLSFACGDGNMTSNQADAGDNTQADAMVSPDADTSICDPSCGEGMACIDSLCCPEKQICADSCCSDGAVCSFGSCVEPGEACLDAGDCGENEYCEATLGEEGEVPPMCVSGTAPAPGKCLPRPPVCPEGETPDDPTACLIACEYVPPVADFNPVLKYAWGSPDAVNNEDSIMMTPIVIQLDDDNCDGEVNERDIPEIVFSTFSGGYYNGNGTLHAISIIEGEIVEKWAVNANDSGFPNHPGLSIAAGNFDGNPGNEIVVCTVGSRARAYDASGAELWLSGPGGCFMPSLADLDQDGNVEIVIGNRVISGATGEDLFSLSEIGGRAIAVDVTGDGVLDLVGPRGVADNTGAVLINYDLADGENASGYVAVADLDNDGTPEIILAESGAHMLHIWHADPLAANGFTRVRDEVNINGDIDPTHCTNPNSAGRRSGGGPPTVADTNGDGFPDIALAGGVGYTVFDGSKLMNSTVANPDTILWAKETQDCSSAQTGSSVFDFNGDGRAEVTYGDETRLRVYDGVTGNELFSTCNTNGTLKEYPVIADIDNDGRADLMVVSNSYSGFNCDGVKTSGLRIYGSATNDWVRTRRIWNQHAYHITNVEEDGTIPRVESTNYLNPKLNNFRLNVQPEGEFSAPDLRIELPAFCSVNAEFLVRVRNFGETAAPAGVPVSVYVQAAGSSDKILVEGTYATTRALYPAEAEDIVITHGMSIESGARIQAIVDETPMHDWRECIEDNNSAESMVGCEID